MKSNKILATAAAAAALLVASAGSQAAPVFAAKVSDGISTIIITDNSALDGAVNDGEIAFAGFGVFGNWNVNFVTGFSQFDPLQMHLAAVFITNSSNFTTGESKVLTVSLSQTGLAGSAPGLVSFGAHGGGSATLGATSSSWAAYADSSDVLFGTGTTVFSSAGYNTAAGGVAALMNNPYSATLVAKFDVTSLSGGGSGSQDLTMQVPEPGTIALAGLGLLALGAMRRRKA